MSAQKLTQKERWLKMIHRRFQKWFNVGGDERWIYTDPANFWWGSEGGLAPAREERHFFPSYYQRDIRRLKRKTFILNRPMIKEHMLPLPKGTVPPRPHLVGMADTRPFWWQNHPQDKGDRTMIYQPRAEDAIQNYPR
jgi:hypothetical protein|uniref:Uncharacterized protein n=1 Tax=Eutreptiella gymnastica TaxID=73025 RepID=A0A7S4CR79_9EUGL